MSGMIHRCYYPLPLIPSSYPLIALDKLPGKQRPMIIYYMSITVNLVIRNKSHFVLLAVFRFIGYLILSCLTPGGLGSPRSRQKYPSHWCSRRNRK